MKKVRYIFLSGLAIVMISAATVNAQEVPVNVDTVAVSAQNAGAQVQNREQVQEQDQTQDQTQAKVQKGNAYGVKKVKSARPDWSKARGARPASVERPSGSRMPKGVGRPGGIKGPGRR